MKIGVDASCWTNKRGYGRYTRELLRALLALDQRNEYRLFLDAETAREADDLPEGVEQVIVGTSRAASRAASAAGRRSLRDLWAMRQAASQQGADLDLFYFPSVYTFFPLKTRARVVVTIHDTTAERYPNLIFPNRQSRLFWKIKVQLALRQAKIVATVSEASKREIVEHFRLSEERVRVVPDAVGGEFYPIDTSARTENRLANYGVNSGERFILYVGGISPHKNLGTLVEAHSMLVQNQNEKDVKLVLIGDYQQDVFYSCYSDLKQQIRKLGTNGNVVFTGFVDDADLVYFYNAAAALVMPSFDEGFGLPSLEAMACGTPVVASRAGALPEVVGEAGLLFDPGSPEELKRQLKQLLSDEKLRARLGRKGLLRAKEFSWKQSARSALAVFEEAVGEYESAAA